MSKSDVKSILVVEDEQDLRQLVGMILSREGFAVHLTDSAETAIEDFQKKTFDLAIVDWMLPGRSGLDLCHDLKGKLPVLILTARADTADIVRGLDAGADDYVTKPFDIPVLLARVRSLLRRGSTVIARTGSIAAGNLRLDLDAHRVTVSGQELHLTPYEFKLLSTLMENQGRVMTRERLIDLVQGSDVNVIDRTIDTHVFGLRKKLGASGDLIETIRGVGYRVES